MDGYMAWGGQLDQQIAAAKMHCRLSASERAGSRTIDVARVFVL